MFRIRQTKCKTLTDLDGYRQPSRSATLSLKHMSLLLRYRETILTVHANFFDEGDERILRRAKANFHFGDPVRRFSSRRVLCKLQTLQW